MPEGDTIFRTARTLERALAGSVVTRFETQIPGLARVDDDRPIAGRTVEYARATGKWLQIGFSGDLVLLTHMLMSGSWHIYRPDEQWRKSRYHMRVVIETAAMVAVAFDVQIAEFHTPASLARRKGFNRLGPDLLGVEFNPAEMVDRLACHPELEIGPALLSQSILAGIGNVYKSEVCFVAEVNPFERVAHLSRMQLESIVASARKLMSANVLPPAPNQIATYPGMRRTTGRSDPTQRLWVYGRDGEPCRRCGAIVESRKQGADARISFWCPACQPLSNS